MHGKLYGYVLEAYRDLWYRIGTYSIRTIGTLQYRRPLALEECMDMPCQHSQWDDVNSSSPRRKNETESWARVFLYLTTPLGTPGGGLSHARTVVRECCKGDDESQWEMGKFDPPPPKNPLTDGHQNLCT